MPRVELGSGGQPETEAILSAEIAYANQRVRAVVHDECARSNELVHGACVSGTESDSSRAQVALRSAAFESALMMMVRVDPRVEPAASAGVTRPQVLADSGATSYADDGLEWHLSNGDGSTWREGAEQLRQEIDDDRRKAEAEAAQTPTNARAEASSTAGVDGAPTLQYYVGGSGCPEHKHMEQPTA